MAVMCGRYGSPSSASGQLYTGNRELNRSIEIDAEGTNR
jgi:hypothetical protein